MVGKVSVYGRKLLPEESVIVRKETSAREKCHCKEGNFCQRNVSVYGRKLLSEKSVIVRKETSAREKCQCNEGNFCQKKLLNSQVTFLQLSTLLIVGVINRVGGRASFCIYVCWEDKNMKESEITVNQPL